MDQRRTFMRGSSIDASAALAWKKSLGLTSRQRITIGAARSCTVRLEDPSVSGQHAALEPNGGSWLLRDLGSTNGTFVAGRRIQRVCRLEVGQRFTIGGVIFKLLEQTLEWGGSGATAIEAHGLTKLVRERERAKTILDGAGLSIAPGEFVAIIGGSGSGKSTLLSALAGRDLDWAGSVLYDGQSLRRVAEEFRPRVGFVPQSTIAHGGLTPGEALWFTAKLSLGRHEKKQALEQRARSALDRADLAELPLEGDQRVSTLSGGQRKRICLAMELLRDLKVIFLDEVTSGLDAASERQVMTNLRALADRGTTVVCVTHHLDYLDVCHKVVFLDHGRVVFTASPQAIRARFGAAFRFADLFGLADAQLRSLDGGWQSTAEQPEPTVLARRNPLARLWAAPRRLLDMVRQTGWLTWRQIVLLWRDIRVTAFFALVAPLIMTRLLCVLTNSMAGSDAMPEQPNLAAWWTYLGKQQMLAFGGILTVLFLGLFAAVQAIVSELEIYKHEQHRGVGTLPYVISKVVPMLVLGQFQAVSVLAALNYFVGTMNGPGLWQQYQVLGTTSAVAMLCGLALSAWIPEGERGDEIDRGTLAIMLMNVVVIPQVLFTNAFVPLQGVAHGLADALISAHWAFEAYDAMFAELVRQHAPGVLAQLDDQLPTSLSAQQPLSHYVQRLGWHALAAFALLLLGMLRKSSRRSNLTARLRSEAAQPPQNRSFGRLVAVAAFLLLALVVPWEREWKGQTARSPRAELERALNACTESDEERAPIIAREAPVSSKKRSAGSTAKPHAD